MGRSLLTAPFDAATELKDASSGAVTSSGAGTVASAAKVLTIGTATGITSMAWITDVDALDVSSGDEGYTLELQGSNDVTFASGVVILGRMSFGKAAAMNESADRGIGRQVKEVFNTLDGQNAFAYVRIFHRLVGTTPSITYRSFLTKSITQ